MGLALPRLDRVEALHVRVPFNRPFVTARGIITHRSSWILRLRDLDGLEGYGEIALDPMATHADEALLAEAIRVSVTGLAQGNLPDPSDLAVWAVSGRALWAGIDEALGSLRMLASATAADTAEEGGRLSRSVAVNATIDMTRPSEALVAVMTAVRDGFSCLKLKVGSEASGAPLLARVGAIRAAVGPAVRIRLDANESWDLSTAVERLNALAAFDIEYVEQPLPARDLDGHAALRRACPVPVALDESVDSEKTAMEILTAGAADVLVVKPARVGGPGVVRAIAEQALLAGVPVVLSTFFETGIGTAAALRAAAALPIVGRKRAHGLATAGVLVHDLLVTPMPMANGRLAVPRRLSVDAEALERFTVETVEGAG